MTGDAKGEYRGTGYRNDAELQAWLAKRPSEAALEQGLPISPGRKTARIIGAQNLSKLIISAAIEKPIRREP